MKLLSQLYNYYLTDHCFMLLFILLSSSLQLFDFELSKSDMALITGFDRGVPLVVPMVDGPDG